MLCGLTTSTSYVARGTLITETNWNARRKSANMKSLDGPGFSRYRTLLAGHLLMER
jgi:hypothetical protein